MTSVHPDAALKLVSVIEGLAEGYVWCDRVNKAMKSRPPDPDRGVFEIPLYIPTNGMGYEDEGLRFVFHCEKSKLNDAMLIDHLVRDFDTGIRVVFILLDDRDPSVGIERGLDDRTSSG